MNSIIIVGNHVKDVEVKSVGQNNTTMATGCIAVKRAFSRDEKSDFFNFKAFGKTAELLGTMRKGQKIAVQGSMEIDNVKDDAGNWKTYCNLMVNQITFVEKKQQQNNEPNPYNNDFAEIDDDDLPF